MLPLPTADTRPAQAWRNRALPWRTGWREAAAVADRWLPFLAAALGVALYARLHHVFPSRPTADLPPNGWFVWFDTGKYLRSALAWSHLDLRATEHWYPPGYPVLGAIGHAITPVQPFYLPDALCLAASLWLFAALAAELTGRRPGARSLGALVFLATTCLDATLLTVWVIPWTTTPATVAIYACLLGTLRFMARPRSGCALGVGLAGGSIALFRPTEAALTLGCAALAMAWTLLLRRAPVRRIALLAAAGAVGVAVPASAFLAGEWATGGFAPTGYLALSARLGFEWRLIPLHWVELFGDPRPLWPGGHGMTLAFPWIVPGLAGMAAALAAARGEARARHGLLIGAVVLHCAVFLAYRDMHPNQIWWIYLYHYFKWVLPVLGLYAALLPVFLLGARRGLALAAGAAALLVLVPWRTELAVLPAAAHPVIRLNDHQLLLPAGLPSVSDAVLVPARGDFNAVFVNDHRLEAAGRRFRAPYDLRGFVRPGGLLLLPLRPLPPAASLISFGPNLVLDPTARALAARQRIVFGLPCWFRPFRAACDPGPFLPGPVLRLDDVLAGQAAAFGDLGDGWSDPEPTGRWTVGRRATLNFRVPDLDGRGVVLNVAGYGYASSADPEPSPIKVYANGALVAVWRPGPGETTLRARIPADRFGPDGRMWVRFLIEDPRAPAGPWDSGDQRRLGLFVHTIRFVPLSGPG